MQTVYSDPGPHADRLAALPSDPAGIAAVARNVIAHYRFPARELPADRLGEVDSRWLDRILDHVDGPLDLPRTEDRKVLGCCRDYTLLTVAALRAHGVPARSRVGFANYLMPDWHADHVVVEYWTGDRWRLFDAQFDPALPWPVDVEDVPRDAFESAARVWLDHRAGKNVDDYGVLPGLPFHGPWFVRNYVVQELAHRQGDELLLWDVWGPMGLELTGDQTLIDEVAVLLVAADAGDRAAEAELTARYRGELGLRPGATVLCHSPTTGPHEDRLR